MTPVLFLTIMNSDVTSLPHNENKIPLEIAPPMESFILCNLNCSSFSVFLDHNEVEESKKNKSFQHT